MKPFDRWNAVIYGDLKITHIARHLLLQLVGQRNAQSGQLNPSIQSLSNSTRMSRRSVFRALKELRKTGLISVKRHSKTSSSYELNLPPYVKRKR